jgi:alpha-L-fucosidase
MVMQMIEAICRDGNFNYSISPTQDGSLEPGAVKMWRDFGKFVKINGEAIYGSRAWKVLGEGRMQADPKRPEAKPSLALFPREQLISRNIDTYQMTTEDIRFTEGKDGSVYAFVLNVPKAGETITIKSMGTDAKLFDKPVVAVSLLGVNDKLQWKQLPDGLVITCPKELSLQYAAVFKVTGR